MTPERWQQVKEVFTHASTLEPPDRDLYVAQACAQDTELRSQVDLLLAAHLMPDAILDHAADHYLPPEEPATADSSEDPWLGKVVGSYQLVACIGRGGMGTVYRARRADAQYEKEVAIKLVRGGFGGELVLQRLRAERQILANLDHSNIARLLDGGVTASGEPFLVLELVDGRPIDEYCDTHDLSTAERLRLFREVCAVVSYAHRHLVVHRDLKPANIFVTAEGSVKLLDFGIAKLLQAGAAAQDAAPEEPTRTSLRAMTPAFSSPEQILGLPVTTASDVYSLGVVLFHLLAGRSPYRSTLGSTRDVIRDVCETEPLRPSIAAAQVTPPAGRRARLDRDLDDIMLRALRKEPEKRYSSVEQFSEDLRRYLAGLPVIARGDRLSYRAGKFWRRHHLALTAAGVVGIALVAGLLITLREARIADEQRALAAQHFASVRKLSNTFIFQVNDAITDLPGAAPARDLLVKTALTYLDALAAQASSDRALQMELADSYERLGDIQGQPNTQNTGQPQAAIASYAKAIALYQALMSANPADAVLLAKMAMAHLKRSRLILLVNGDLKGASQESGLAIDLSIKVSQMKPEDVAATMALATAYRVHAANELWAGHSAPAVAAADKAVTVMEALYRRRPDDREVQRNLGSAYSAVQVLSYEPLSPDAIERKLAFAHKALALDMHLFDTDPKHEISNWRNIGSDWNGLGILLFLKGDLPAAVDAFQTAAADMEKTTADAHNAQAQVDVARSHMNLERARFAAGHLAEAHEGFLKNIQLIESMPQSKESREVQYFLAVCEEELGGIEAQSALEAKDPAQQLREWRSANAWFAKSAPRFKSLLGAATLDVWDRPPVDRASAGLTRSAAEIRRREDEQTLAHR